MEAQLGSSVAFGSGCGQALPGVPRKALLCLYAELIGHWKLGSSAGDWAWGFPVLCFPGFWFLAVLANIHMHLQ